MKIKTKYGTKVEFIDFETIYVIVEWNDKRHQVLFDDFDDESQKYLNSIKE